MPKKGYKQTEFHKRNIVKALKGKSKPSGFGIKISKIWKGIPKSENHKKNLKASWTSEKRESFSGNKNPIYKPGVIEKLKKSLKESWTIERRKNISGDNCIMKRKGVIEKFKGDNSPAKGEVSRKKRSITMLKKLKEQGYINSADTRRKMRDKWTPERRMALIEYIKNNCGGVLPFIGKYEKQILDNLQDMIGFSIKRQFYINGYWLDGYCQELNLAIEVDEEHHFKNNILSKKDREKQNNIMKALGCDFIRIRVSEVIKNKEIDLEALNKTNYTFVNLKP